MKILAVFTLVLSSGLTSSVSARQATPSQQPDPKMMERGHHAMGFDQTKTTHHFLLKPSGGAIEITANDSSDRTSIASIRSHLEHIRGAFAAGNFAMPMFIHGTEPPGAAMLSQRRDALTYRFEEIPTGGRLNIATTDADALKALHDFLKFQIVEHKTGDPLLPK